MARIRSIKPDFFTSEKIASLPLSARLLFIGLWTHVDDNGVTVDNERLINAAIWPLEDDPLEALQRTREDLRRLSTARLIVRYEAAGKALLFISGWDEHQKVSHPAKPRYPRPTPEQMNAPTGVVSSGDAAPQEPGTDSSGESPEDLPSPLEIFAPEQGAGSREQGKEVPPSAGAAAPSPPADRPLNAGDVVAAYMDGAKAGGLPAPTEVLRGRVGKRAGALIKAQTDPQSLLTAAFNCGAGGWTDIDTQLQRDAAAAKPRPVANSQPSNGSGHQLPPRDGYDVNKILKNRKSA